MWGRLEVLGNARLARRVLRAVICAALAAAFAGAPPRARASDEEPLDPGVPPPVHRVARPVPAGRDAVDHAWIAVKGGVGLFPIAAARLQVFLSPAGKVRAILEGGRGVYFGGPAWGGGLRAQIELARGARDAMLLSPGVELWKEPPTTPGFFGHSNTLHETIFDADLSWLHLFASHVGWELGLRAGVITGDDKDGSRFRRSELQPVHGDEVLSCPPRARTRASAGPLGVADLYRRARPPSRRVGRRGRRRTRRRRGRTGRGRSR